MPVEIVHADIAKVKAEVIVNAANEWLQEGGGVCGAIFQAAGSELSSACEAIGRCEPGKAVITPGFNLCDYIIHAVAPEYISYGEQAWHVLESCYIEIFRAVEKLGASSVAIPALGTGLYGLPPEKAFQIATYHSQRAVEGNPELNVILVFYHV